MPEGQPEREQAILRPVLLPAQRWAKVALILLMLFALLRSVAWASSQPGWVAPDEDYHWEYTEYVLTQHAFPRLGELFYTAELYYAVRAINQDQYLIGARHTYRGNPHAVVGALGRLPVFDRYPANPPPRPLVHPPLYYVGSVLVDHFTTTDSPITRLTLIRYYSAAVGMLAVFFAWLLAAQVLSRTWEQLAVAALVATQPIIAFSSSTITIDVATIASVGAVLAWLAFLLRVRPHPRQGIGLGIVLGLALLSKATTLALLPVAAVTLLLLWRRYPQSGRAVLGIAGWAAGVTALIAGWWYVRSTVVIGNPLGEHGSLLNGPHGPTQSTGQVLSIAGRWFSNVYRGYWFDYLNYEVLERNLWYWLPAVVGLVGIVGLTWWAIEHRRDSSARTLQGQVLILVLTPLVLTVPWLLIDLRRALAGYTFAQDQGRYMTPAYAAAAILLLIGLRQLARNRPRATGVAVAVVVAISFVLYWRTWLHWNIERFYGPINGDLLRAFSHASFDKPQWVTAGFFVGVVSAAIACFVAAFVIVLRGVRRLEPAGASGDLSRPRDATAAQPRGPLLRPH